MNLVNSATALSGAASCLVVTVGGVYAFDDVQVSAEDLSATSYSYDAANQLTAMNVNGTTTNFTYDDWGRMVGKTQGAYAATYAYRFGDKLKAATSNLPGETASVGYNYDGLGRRRLEQRDNTTATWFRWSGSEECGEYAGTVGSWTIGALQTDYTIIQEEVLCQPLSPFIRVLSAMKYRIYDTTVALMFYIEEYGIRETT